MFQTNRSNVFSTGINKGPEAFGNLGASTAGLLVVLGVWEVNVLGQSVDQCSPTSWWNGMCSHTQLSKVATGFLTLPPTSASVERSFSRHAHIHSSDRNRLSTDRAANLVYVVHHLTLDEKLHQASTPQPSTLPDAPLSM